MNQTDGVQTGRHHQQRACEESESRGTVTQDRFRADGKASSPSYILLVTSPYPKALGLAALYW
jgi:hypothetical protein